MESFEEKIKKQIFKTWDGFILILELSTLIYNDSEILKEILRIQTAMKIESERLHYRKSKQIALKDFYLDINVDIIESIVKTWELLEIYTDLDLQDVKRRHGTTTVHRQAMWRFHKNHREKYLPLLLQLKKS